MIDTLAFLFGALGVVVPLSAIYWFIVREHLLLCIRMALARLHFAVIAVARRMEDDSPAQAEAIQGHISCLSFKRDLEEIDFGEVLIKAFEARRRVAFPPLDVRISDDDVEVIQELQQRFSKLILCTALVNSPALFPIVAMVFFCAEWSDRAHFWKERVQSGAVEAARMAAGPAYA